MNAIHGFIAFLRCEANQAEERARSLRATAASIEANAHSGRKKRKRESKPKRSHTGYSLYVQENYDAIKKSSGSENVSSKDILSLVARQWSSIGEQEKQAWQYRAEQLKEAGEGLEAAHADIMDELGLPEGEGEGDDWGSRKKPARKLLDKADVDTTADV